MKSQMIKNADGGHLESQVHLGMCPMNAYVSDSTGFGGNLSGKPPRGSMQCHTIFEVFLNLFNAFGRASLLLSIKRAVMLPLVS